MSMHEDDRGPKPKRMDPREEPPDSLSPAETTNQPSTAMSAQTSLPPPEPRRDSGRVITSQDPRLDTAERLLGTGDWKEMLKTFGPPDKAGALPPNLGILYALALGESGGEDSTAAANEIALRCAAGLLGVPTTSAVALVVSKRLLRKNPVSLKKRAAPKTGTSLLIVVITLVLGAALGWFLSSGSLRFWREFQ